MSVLLPDTTSVPKTHICNEVLFNLASATLYLLMATFEEASWGMSSQAEEIAQTKVFLFFSPFFPNV